MVCGLWSFRVASIVNYFLLRQADDGLPADDTRNLESSYRLYCRSFVHDGEICATDDSKKLFMRFKCKATMKSNVRYSLRAMFQRQNLLTPLQLVYADCSCPAGAPLSTCKHVGAMCYGVEEFCRHGVFKGVTSCTSQLQRWNAPRPTGQWRICRLHGWNLANLKQEAQ